MKKSIILIAVSFCISYQISAQISKGGLPQTAKTTLSFNNFPVSSYANPDWEAYLQKEKESTKFAKPFVVAQNTAADFGFPESGQFVTLDNGQTVWRGQIAVIGAPAIGLKYDRFYLPKGVRLFLTNENRKQVLGAFDVDNNDASGTFITDAVQGEKVTIELDIDPEVNLRDIQLHINGAAVFHRGIENLKTYASNTVGTWDYYDSVYNGASSVCMVNAICPQGANYSNNRKATVQIVFEVTMDGQVFYAACSGTLVNNTGNTTSNCKPYLLTATHCEGTGSVSSTTFDQTIVRFNFEHSTCTGGANPAALSMTGLNFVARSDYNADLGAVNQIKGDFLLFSFRQAIPESYGAILSGWNNNLSIATSVSEPKKFIGFHHPDGDNKKLSYAHQIRSVAMGAPDTHWGLTLENSYGSTGSSGSGLFDGDGYLIGQVSLGGNSNVPENCVNNAAGNPTNIGDNIYYSKFSYVWDYAVDGSAANRKLKPWLDPAGTNVVTINPLTATCAAISTTSINKVDDDLSNNISIFPNPNRDGLLTVQYNLKASKDLLVSVYDVTGKTVYQSKVSKVQNGTARLDLQSLSAGMYIIKFTTEDGFAIKKLMIQQ
ncbi:hypothetical protein DBR32_04370 [Taibaiella sp. KBW10]|uniref:T9SS type A sorting domain-containing protein n=1 Tax=Taibaiella sp. KBW10 TaxID=2153357 RepID=UPI000F59F371|nr:T9SS type A sorting domain-containing protein [Taibaiella sp. KBW10]RQO31210.1 hypothetical protein DBR32_04370 [Taibaiella sp. KBW10]